jgi:hypothetical protein
MTLPKPFHMLDDNDPTNLPMNPQDPILQEGHYCSCRKYFILDVRHYIVSIRQCFQWFKEKYLHKRPVCSSDCVHYVEDIRTPSIAPNPTSAITTISQEHVQCNTLRTVNHSDGPGNTSSSTSSISTNDHHSMDFDGNKDSYTRTTQVIATGGRTKTRTLSQYTVKVQHTNNQFVTSDGAKSIITDAATVTTNQNRILTRSKHPMSPLPPLSPSRQSITIKNNRKTSERTDYSDAVSTTTSDSMSTVTMDPAIRVVSSLSSDSLLLLQSNDPSVMISPSPFQRQQRHEKASLQATANVESQYHANGQYHHHTIYTMDDSIWHTGDNGDFDYEKTAPKSLEENISIPQPNRKLSTTIQNKVPWKNRYLSDYNSEPILSKVAPLQLLEI